LTDLAKVLNNPPIESDRIVLKLIDDLIEEQRERPKELRVVGEDGEYLHIAI
jgi:hypothetical protein